MSNTDMTDDLGMPLPHDSRLAAAAHLSLSVRLLGDEIRRSAAGIVAERLCRSLLEMMIAAQGGRS